MATPSTTESSAVTSTPNQTPQNATNTSLSSTTTNPTIVSGSDGSTLIRATPDRKTIHTAFPSRSHQSSSTTADPRGSTRNPSSMSGSNDGSLRQQQSTTGATAAASSVIGSTGSGAQSFLSKLSSKFARR